MNEPTDIFGIKPFGEALETAVKKSLDGLGTFLSIACKPALEELGMMMKDRVRIWRLNNVVKILEKAKENIEFRDGEFQLKANPKVTLAVIENGCDETNDELQQMWAGLINASMSVDGLNDDGIIYINLLKQMSIAEMRIFRYMCENSKKGLGNQGLPTAQTVSPYLPELISISGLKRAEDIEAILNHLSASKLNESRHLASSPNFRPFKDSLLAWLTPSTLALTLYIRCQGFRGSIAEYWNLEPWEVITARQNEANKQN